MGKRRPGKRERRNKVEYTSLDPEYAAYLRSTQWKAKRRRIIAERGAKCEVCGWDEGQFSLHHLTYVRLYDELDSDLLLTCDSCHAAFHGRWGQVRAIGCNRHEKAQRKALASWKERNRTTLPTQKLAPAPAEANEWDGYDPFADASAPVSWHGSRTTTPALKDKY